MIHARRLLEALGGLSLSSAQALIVAAAMVTKGVEIEILMPGVEHRLLTRLGTTGLRYEVLGIPLGDSEKKTMGSSVQSPVAHVFVTKPGQAFMHYDGPIHHETKTLLIVVDGMATAHKIVAACKPFEDQKVSIREVSLAAV